LLGGWSADEPANAKPLAAGRLMPSLSLALVAHAPLGALAPMLSSDSACAARAPNGNSCRRRRGAERKFVARSELRRDAA